jgi:hypothetical protein
VRALQGELRAVGDASAPGCAASYPRFHALERGGRSAAEVAADLACVAPRGDGCAIEQPLEAVLRALAPEATANAGFLRERSLLAIVIVSDQDDCSAADPRLFDPADAELGVLAVRCGLHPELLHPIERYRAAIAAGGHAPRRMLLASIAGVPGDAISFGTPEYDAILARRDMEVRVDPEMPTQLVPSCGDAIGGSAVPPRRLVTAGRALSGLGVSVGLHSICEPIDQAIERVVWGIADRTGGACLPRSLSAPSPRRWEECALTEVLPIGARCDEYPGRPFLRTVLLAGGPEREECVVRALTREEAIAGELGWYLDTADAPLPGSNVGEACGVEGRRIEIVGEIALDSDVRVHCPESIGPDGGTCH